MFIEGNCAIYIDKNLKVYENITEIICSVTYPKPWIFLKCGSVIILKISFEEIVDQIDKWFSGKFPPGTRDSFVLLTTGHSYIQP